jgi:hypothetical protein
LFHITVIVLLVPDSFLPPKKLGLGVLGHLQKLGIKNIEIEVFNVTAIVLVVPEMYDC